VIVLTADGMPLTTFGIVGTTPGKFSFPVDVAFGPENTVMVLDRMRHKIIVFDENYDFITEYGRMGGAPGAFYHPVSLAYASGRAYVAQGFEGRVQVFNVFSTDADNLER
jgi:tripartite motif-containing protein 71